MHRISSCGNPDLPSNLFTNFGKLYLDLSDCLFLHLW